MSLEHEAIDLITQRGVVFKVPAPLWLRVIGVNSVPLRIKPLYLGTILEIRKLRDQPDDIEVQAECIALAVLNNRWLIRLLRKQVKRYILKHIRSDSLFELFVVIQTLNREKDFMTLTNWVTHIGQEVMQPMEMQLGS